MYKFISKVPANRMRGSSQSYFSLQSAFVTKRDIHDNILVAHEIHIVFETRSKNGYIAIKLDMEKAEDRLVRIS